jgi:aryl-alcohol dehydrogenase-like predicted oxidoreductase
MTTMSARLKIGAAEVARIGLGTNRLTNTRENVAFVKAATEAGVDFIDTAHLYTGGESEKTIGLALSPIPERVIVATKGGFRPRQGRREVLHAQIDESLRRLGTDSIALYYLHKVDPETPLEESIGALKECLDSGKIRAVGVSNVTIEQVERARRVVPIAAVQNPYNLAERQYDDVVDYCANEGIVFVPYFPLRTRPPALSGIAERRGATPEQIALAWLLKRSRTTLPIPGTLSLEHLKQNLGALEIELDDAEFQALR